MNKKTAKRSSVVPDMLVQGADWRDIDGHPIACHGGGMSRFGDRFYWYGTSCKWNPKGACGPKARQLQNGFSVYSSKDLIRWKHEGVCLDFSKAENAIRGMAHRPNVIYNDKTKKYVMWFFDRAKGRGVMMTVAVARKPAGPFEIVGRRRTAEPHGRGRDCGLFKDDDGKAYLVYDDGSKKLRVDLLSDDYLSSTKQSVIALKPRHEGAAMIKYKGKYLVAGSGACGGGPSTTHYAVADSPLGPYSNKKIMGEKKTWGSQISNFIYVKENDTVIALCDQWLAGAKGRADSDASRPLFLPVLFNFSTGEARMEYRERWNPMEPLAVVVPTLSPRPAAVAGVKNPRFDLNGTWRFNPAPAAGFGTKSKLPREAGWADIQVPGQWAQQGFELFESNAAGYCRSFVLPKDWTGKRIKLRCDGVYSDATVWVGGKEIGRHLGGFTPFEFDVTDAATPGQETVIALAVQRGGPADQFACGIGYAMHDLGGISRKIYLMALPEVNISSLHTLTTFDGNFKNAELAVDLTVANNGVEASLPSSAKLELRDPKGKKVATCTIDVPPIKAGGTECLNVRMQIAQPMKWDVEHPNLYTITTVLGSGRTAETVTTRVGFRQVDVRGNQMLVNGKVVKLRGVCRHEVHPTRGRSLEGDMWRNDAELFAHANVNFVRTSHYPPAEEFLDACDEIGLLVESEAPFCWAPAGAIPEVVVSQTMEMVEVNRNHPSVVIWSIANESHWGAAFELSANMVSRVDSSRPRMFSYGKYIELDVFSKHYPSFDGPAEADKNAKPVLFDEYCHLNAYNRREQIADPGLRDAWALSFSKMWESILVHQGCLGGAIWAAIDDTFYLPGDRMFGFGTWGPLDGWRRAKPEYWHMTKVYSPVRILTAKKVRVPAKGEPIRLTVENRSDFADLSEMRFVWKLAGKSGKATVKAAPGQKGTLVIPVGKREVAGKQLEVRVTGPRGFLVDEYRFVIGDDKVAVPTPLRNAGSLELKQDKMAISVRGNGFKYVIDARTGQLLAGGVGGREMSLLGPHLTLVPLDHEGGTARQSSGKEPSYIPLWGLCGRWRPSSVTASKVRKVVRVKVAGSYPEAEGGYELAIEGNGRMTVTWSFTSKIDINPRQTGMSFTMAKDFDTLSWRRKGQWTTYPEDHIGRLLGKAKAFPGHPPCQLTGPRTKPEWPWGEDQNQYGCNDFRSSKFNILEATLTDDQGAGLRAVAAADRHVRTWIDDWQALMMVADYANDGDESFLERVRFIPDKKIVKGGVIAGSVQVEIVGNA